MAAQDFRHAAQEDQEKVSDFIQRLERLFKLAYGHDGISVETRNTLLYGQMQEGLKHKIMESPAVSGTTDYQNLCLAAKAEEKRLAELNKRRQYQSDQKHKHTSSTKPEGLKTQQSIDTRSDSGPSRKGSLVRCWNCQHTLQMSVKTLREEEDCNSLFEEGKVRELSKCRVPNQGLMNLC